MVLEDTITAAGLAGQVACLTELSVFEHRPDIWIVVKNGTTVPIGVVEVKTPSSTIMKSKHVHGQTFDYMLRFAVFKGLRSVFGIVST